jgi:hypothetical protein
LVTQRFETCAREAMRRLTEKANRMVPKLTKLAQENDDEFFSCLTPCERQSNLVRRAQQHSWTRRSAHRSASRRHLFVLHIFIPAFLIHNQNHQTPGYSFGKMCGTTRRPRTVQPAVRCRHCRTNCRSPFVNTHQTRLTRCRTQWMCEFGESLTVSLSIPIVRIP